MPLREFPATGGLLAEARLRRRGRFRYVPIAPSKLPAKLPEPSGVLLTQSTKGEPFLSVSKSTCNESQTVNEDPHRRSRTGGNH